MAGSDRSDASFAASPSWLTGAMQDSARLGVASGPVEIINVGMVGPAGESPGLDRRRSPPRRRPGRGGRAGRGPGRRRRPGRRPPSTWPPAAARAWAPLGRGLGVAGGPSWPILGKNRSRSDSLLKPVGAGQAQLNTWQRCPRRAGRVHLAAVQLDPNVPVAAATPHDLTRLVAAADARWFYCLGRRESLVLHGSSYVRYYGFRSKVTSKVSAGSKPPQPQ